LLVKADEKHKRQKQTKFDSERLWYKSSIWDDDEHSEVVHPN
jgi:hypothetical protein